MSWGVAVFTGVGLGLAYFGGLRLGVRRALLNRQAIRWIAWSRLIRTAPVAVTFYALSREGIGVVLAALAGFWLARWHLMQRWGGPSHGQQ